MSVDPSSFRIDPDPEDAFNLSRVAENESVFSASRVNLMVPKNLAGSQAALQVSDSARSTSQFVPGATGPSPDFELG